jgi:hypothetical protein
MAGQPGDMRADPRVARILPMPVRQPVGRTPVQFHVAAHPAARGAEPERRAEKIGARLRVPGAGMLHLDRLARGRLQARRAYARVIPRTLQPPLVRPGRGIDRLRLRRRRRGSVRPGRMHPREPGLHPSFGNRKPAFAEAAPAWRCASGVAGQVRAARRLDLQVGPIVLRSRTRSRTRSLVVALLRCDIPCHGRGLRCPRPIKERGCVPFPFFSDRMCGVLATGSR